MCPENNYYPFGLKHKGYNISFSPIANAKAQSFKFNGIELEENTGFYEMNFRSYDPSIARWTSIDPVTHYDYSTYSSFDNNPIFWADPSGADSERSTTDIINDVWRRSQNDGYAYSYDGEGNLTSVTNNSSGGCDDCNKCPETCTKNSKKAKSSSGAFFAPFGLQGFDLSGNREKVLEDPEVRLILKIGAEVATFFIPGGILVKVFSKGGIYIYISLIKLVKL